MTEGTERTQRRSKLGEEERAKLLREGWCFKCRNVGHLCKDWPEKRHSPISRRVPSLARNSAPDPQVSFVYPNWFSVLSEAEDENDDFKTVESNPSFAHPKDYEASQVPRPRSQNPELRTRPGRKLNLEDKTTSTICLIELRNREVSGYSDQVLAFALQPPVTNDSADYEISNVKLSTHPEELLRYRGKVDGQEAVFLLDSR